MTEQQAMESARDWRMKHPDELLPGQDAAIVLFEMLEKNNLIPKDTPVVFKVQPKSYPPLRVVK